MNFWELLNYQRGYFFDLCNLIDCHRPCNVRRIFLTNPYNFVFDHINSKLIDLLLKKLNILPQKHFWLLVFLTERLGQKFWHLDHHNQLSDRGNFSINIWAIFGRSIAKLGKNFAVHLLDNFLDLSLEREHVHIRVSLIVCQIVNIFLWESKSDRRDSIFFRKFFGPGSLKKKVRHRSRFHTFVFLKITKINIKEIHWDYNINIFEVQGRGLFWWTEAWQSVKAY